VTGSAGTPPQRNRSLARALIALRQGRLADARSFLEQLGADDHRSATRPPGSLRAGVGLRQERRAVQAAIRMNSVMNDPGWRCRGSTSSAGRDAEAERALETIRVIPASGARTGGSHGL
jgi:hypothetical protein